MNELDTIYDKATGIVQRLKSDLDAARDEADRNAAALRLAQGMLAGAERKADKWGAIALTLADTLAYRDSLVYKDSRLDGDTCKDCPKRDDGEWPGCINADCWLKWAAAQRGEK